MGEGEDGPSSFSFSGSFSFSRGLLLVLLVWEGEEGGDRARGTELELELLMSSLAARLLAVGGLMVSGRSSSRLGSRPRVRRKSSIRRIPRAARTSCGGPDPEATKSKNCCCGVREGWSVSSSWPALSSMRLGAIQGIRREKKDCKPRSSCTSSSCCSADRGVPSCGSGSCCGSGRLSKLKSWSKLGLKISRSVIEVMV